jgi:hypothetical protein
MEQYLQMQMKNGNVDIETWERQIRGLDPGLLYY